MAQLHLTQTREAKMPEVTNDRGRRNSNCGPRLSFSWYQEGAEEMNANCWPFLDLSKAAVGLYIWGHVLGTFLILRAIL